jgi:hypothetical protein
MAWWGGTRPTPPGPPRGTQNLTVPEDEFRMASVGRVASCALVGRKIGCRNTRRYRRHVTLIGTSATPVNVTMPKYYATRAFLSILRAVSMPSV